MPHFDLSLDALRTYQPELTAPDDFDAFWEKTLVEARSTTWTHALSPSMSRTRQSTYSTLRTRASAGIP